MIVGEPLAAGAAAIACVLWPLLLPAAPPADEDAGGAGRVSFPRFDWGVELELELSDAGDDAAQPEAHFQIDQLYLYPELSLAPGLTLRAEIAVKGDGTIIEEAWFQWAPDPRLWLKAGLEDPVIAQVDRKTEAEILLETAFYRSDEMGVQAGGSVGPNVAWWVSATNGTALGLKQPSEDEAFPLLHDGRRLDGAGQLTLGAGLRLEAPLANGTAWMMPFAYRGRVNDTLADLGIGASDTRERRGANVGWDGARLGLLGQVLDARDGSFEQRGVFVQPAWRVGSRLEAVYRYNRLRVDVAPRPDDSRTWDRTQHVAALIVSLYDGVLLKTEYYVNDETTGGADVDNDELLVQLEVAWP